MADLVSNYVKFRRGTPTAFAALTEKDIDTLYFIYEEDKSTGELYLGSKLIAGSGEINGATALDDLSDVLLNKNLNAKDCLIYDITQQKWVSQPIMSVIDEFVGANSTSKGVAGLVPVAPKEGATNLFLRSDGQWAEIVTASSVSVYQTIVASTETHLDAINRIIDGKTIGAGDIVVLRDNIANNLYEHIAYVHNGSVWVAMDGNYDAENVYFAQDLMTTTAIGNIVLENGQATIPAAGKNLKQVFETIFVEEDNPDITQPSISITASNNKAYEVGTEVTPSYSGSYSAGSYQYGPDTNVTASNWKAVDSNNIEKEGQSGSFSALVVEDDTNYKITISATLSAGAVPKTNLGNDYLEGQIAESVKSVTSGAITGYRNSFYGTLSSKDSITSDTVRSLTATNKAMANGGTMKISIPIGCMRVMFAYPATLRDVTSVLDKNDSNANIVTGFTKTLLDVEGKNGYEAISYKVYTMDFANPYDAKNEFNVTI